IIACVLNAQVVSLETEQGPSFGAAILAMVGCGEYASVEEATARIVREKSCVSPDPKFVAAYEKGYRVFRKLYPALQAVWNEQAV
ncbi:MAG: xylulokinase, partial [Christensenellaceae bacterium]